MGLLFSSPQKSESKNQERIEEDYPKTDPSKIEGPHSAAELSENSDYWKKQFW